MKTGKKEKLRKAAYLKDGYSYSLVIQLYNMEEVTLKHLVLIVIAVGAYWAYHHYSYESKELSLAEKIEINGSVSASEVLEKANEMVSFICKGDEVLRSWGSNSTECFKKVSDYGELCERRIFPDMKKLVTNSDEAKNLMSRYNKCVLPG